MLQFVIFAFIFAGMMFIWTFVYLNRSKDKINQAFLSFLSILLLWMVLSLSNTLNDGTSLGLVFKTIYFYSMMNMSVFFLYFIYRLIERQLDFWFYFWVIVNTLTIVSRYFLPIDYSDPTFWRLSIPIVAPLMSAIFSMPAVYALYLVIRQYGTSKNYNLKGQLRNICVGIGIALSTSVLSEYVLPTIFHINMQVSLMYLAILIFVIFTFIAVTKHKFLSIQSAYIYRRLFLNSGNGIIIINKHQRIVSINNIAKEILQNEKMDAGDRMTDYMADYDFEINYRQHEITMATDGDEKYLSITQYPIESDDADSAKLMLITDITSSIMSFKREKDMLIERSAIDQLTGLYNKRFFLDHYSGDNQVIFKGNASVMFIDVDNFKSINDIYGHIIGDRFLKALAECIKKNIGDEAKAIRFGGDEFVVILEDTSINDAFMKAEKIRSDANEIGFSDIGNIDVSLSIGLTEGSAHIKELTNKADMAMYHSKSGGKNRTTIF